jgi:hypothetical protein
LPQGCGKASLYGWAVVVPRRFSLVHLILVTFAKTAVNCDLVTKFGRYFGYLLPTMWAYFKLRNFKHDFYAKVVTDIFRWSDGYWSQRKIGPRWGDSFQRRPLAGEARLENQL